MKKKCKVVMLPTKSKSGTIWKTSSGQLINTHVSGKYKNEYIPHCLYIVSDDEIKEGDWYWWKVTNTIQRFKKMSANDTTPSFNDGSRKIIATTDESLKYWSGENGEPEWGLPKLSEAFIKEYCEKGGIDEVDVEYIGQYKTNVDGEPIGLPVHNYIPKVNPDNTITIHSIHPLDEIIRICRLNESVDWDENNASEEFRIIGDKLEKLKEIVS